MTEEQTPGALRARVTAMAEALERAERDPAAADRDRLRDDIVGAFRDVEGRIAELTELKEAIRPLVDRYRALYPRAGAAPPRAPASVRVDHLGSSTFVERGWNAIAGESHEQAVRELERALQLAPGDTRAEALLGWALMRSGRLPEARALLEGVLAREPGHPLATANLGYVALREGQFARAIELLSPVARGATDRTALLYANLYLGMVYAEREMYRDALGFFGRTLELGPNLIEAYWQAGWCQYREGDRAGAAETWRRGAETNRFNPWGERCGRAAAQALAGEDVSAG